jgi:soluble lytic murein transglycosylase-like protein
MALPALTKLVPLAFSMAFGFGAETGTSYQTAFLTSNQAAKTVVRSEAPQVAAKAPVQKKAVVAKRSACKDPFAGGSSVAYSAPAPVTYEAVAYEPAPADGPDAKLLECIRVNAEKNGIDPLLVEIVIKHESAFDPNACSGVGASGLMQLMPETAQELGVTDLNDPEQNVAAGTKYLAQQMEKYDGNVQLALAAYNAGPGNVDYYGGIPPFEETQNYAHSISSEYWERSAQ